MQNLLDELLNREVITQAEATDMEFAVLIGDASQGTAIRVLNRIDSIRSRVGPRRCGYDVAGVLGRNGGGAGRVIRTLKI